MWSLAGEWVANYLNVCPDVAPADVEAILRELPPLPTQFYAGERVTPLEGSTLKLSRGVYFVSIRYGETGTFFVVAPDAAGRYRVAWSVDDFAASAKGDIACWRVEASCGPLSGAGHPLPATSRGNPRFYVNALNAGQGQTVGGQTSVWEWTGTTAVLRANRSYRVMIDDPEGADTFDGNVLKVHMKGGAGHFLCGYGSCPHPRTFWRVRVTPERVEDLGVRLAEPEFQLLDDVLVGILRHTSMSHLASPDVAAELERLISKVGQSEEDFIFSLMEAEETQFAKETRLRLLTDAYGEIEFTIRSNGTDLYISEMKVRGWKE